MARKSLRAGIVGAGFSANFHYEALRRAFGVDVDIRGVYAIDPEETKQFAATREIKAYSTLDELLDDVDVVHVCVWTAGHEEIAVAALERGKYPIVEKPFTGYMGDGSADFDGDSFPKKMALTQAMQSVDRMLAAERDSDARILYAENWVYAPAIQREREILEKTGAQILWMHGEEGHSGSHNPTYGRWQSSGGGTLIGKGCHPLTAALYLKRVEGLTNRGRPIMPKTVSSRSHSLTRNADFRDEGMIRCDYEDIEDWSMAHITFEDGMIATIFASEIILGGIHNWIEIAANNHRTVCNINPNTAMQVYNERAANFDDIYTVEKIGTKSGWVNMPPDEDWFTGYPQEIEAFYRTIAYGDRLESDSALAADTIATIYSAYLSAERGGAEVSIDDAVRENSDKV